MMSGKRIAAAVLLALAVGLIAALIAAPVASDPSHPLPVPKDGPRERAVAAYNEGVRLMVDRRYAAAQQKFEEALSIDERLAEAHNNLAFSLRVQGTGNHTRALTHYARAVELKPDLARAYLYRGVLFAQMGDLDRARADHRRLLALDPGLAAKLDAVIAGGAADDGYEGLTAQYD
jgi:tetratricopeptide (TPR) repeat protein